MIKAMYAGTFNPIHKGHINVIKRASKIFDKLAIVVSRNENKIKNEDKALIDDAFFNVTKVIKKINLKNVEVLINKDFLTADFAKKHKCDILIRGIRNDTDLKNEIEMAEINRKIGKIDTIFFSTEKKFLNVSSTALRKQVNLKFKA